MRQLGALNGQVRAYSAQDGSELWQVQLSSEIITAPAISANVIAVRTQDGRLYGLDPANGSRRWVYEQTVPVLSLRGNSSPLIGNGFVIDGFDTGRLVAVRDVDGAPAWVQVLAAGEGHQPIVHQLQGAVVGHAHGKQIAFQVFVYLNANIVALSSHAVFSNIQQMQRDFSHG